MATPLKSLNSTSIKEFSTSEENYIAHQIGLHLGAADSSEVSSINKITGGTTIGSYTNTFFNQAVGTHPSTSITTGSTVTPLKQTSGTAAETDSDVYGPVMWVDSSAVSQTGFKIMPDADLNAAIDRYLSTIFTNNYPGTYQLGSSSPGGTYSVHLANAFTDTRTDGTSVQYNIYKKTSGSAPTTVRPMFVEDSADGGGIKLREMNDRQIQYSFGQRAKTRSAAAGSIGSYQLRSSAQGAPSDAGTWVAKGTAVDTKQTTSQQVFTRDSTVNFQANYTKAYTSNYATNYTKLSQINYQSVSQINYTNLYERTFTRNASESFTVPYTKAYTKAYEKAYTTAYAGTYIRRYTGTYTNNFATNYVSNTDVNYTPNYTRAYTGTYNKIYTSNYVTNYQTNFIRNNNVNYTTAYAGTYQRMYTSNYVTNYVSVTDVGYQRGYTGTYNKIYTSNYLRNFLRTTDVAYVRRFVRNTDVAYVSPAFQAGYEGSSFAINYQRRYTGEYQRQFGTGYQNNFQAGYQQNFLNYFNTGYQRVYTNIFARFYASAVSENFAVTYQRNFTSTFLNYFDRTYLGLANYNRLYETNYVPNYQGPGSFTLNYQRNYTGEFIVNYVNAATYTGEGVQPGAGQVVGPDGIAIRVFQRVDPLDDPSNYLVGQPWGIISKAQLQYSNWPILLPEYIGPAVVRPGITSQQVGELPQTGEFIGYIGVNPMNVFQDHGIIYTGSAVTATFWGPTRAYGMTQLLPGATFPSNNSGPPTYVNIYYEGYVGPSGYYVAPLRIGFLNINTEPPVGYTSPTPNLTGHEGFSLGPYTGFFPVMKAYYTAGNQPDQLDPEGAHVGSSALGYEGPGTGIAINYVRSVRYTGATRFFSPLGYTGGAIYTRGMDLPDNVPDQQSFVAIYSGPETSVTRYYSGTAFYQGSGRVANYQGTGLEAQLYDGIFYSGGRQYLSMGRYAGPNQAQYSTNQFLGDTGTNFGGYEGVLPSNWYQRYFVAENYYIGGQYQGPARLAVSFFLRTDVLYAAIANYASTYSRQFNRAYESVFPITYVQYVGPVYTGGFSVAFIDTATPYVKAYTNIYTSDYTNSYARLYTGNYTNNYTGAYATNYARNYTRAYTGNFLNNYVRDYTSNYLRDYTSNYVSVTDVNYQQNYVPNYIRAYTPNYIRRYTGEYDIAYTRRYTGNYAITYTRNAFAVDYDGAAFQANYTKRYTGNYQNEYVLTSFAVDYEGASFNTAYQRLYEGNYLSDYQIEYVRNAFAVDYTGPVFNAQYVGPVYAGTYEGNYQKDYTSTFESTFDTPYEGASFQAYYNIDYVTDYVATYVGQYTGIYVSNYIGSYDKIYTGTYTGDYIADYIGNYETTYTRNFEETYVTDYLGNFEGNFEGETIDSSSETIETYTLYVRIS